jgi:hypothetical protein
VKGTGQPQLAQNNPFPTGASRDQVQRTTTSMELGDGALNSTNASWSHKLVWYQVQAAILVAKMLRNHNAL